MAINAEGFLAALEEIETQKGISKETVLVALKEALAKGFRKQLGGDDADVRINIVPEDGIIEMFNVKKVVDEVEDDFLEISVEDANEADHSKKYVAGDEFFIPATLEELKKATAMSIKSIMKQKFAEAEKGILFEAFKDKIGTMITGKVEKVDERGVSVNITRTSVYLPRQQLIGDEKFAVGDQIKLFVSDVASGPKGASIVVSRSSEGFLQCLFNEEVREIYDGTIIIKKIAREAGERSKVAVYSNDPNVDPAGACIGPNGSRIQKIVSQLGNNGSSKEKIDIIGYSDVPGLYIMEALKPARVAGIILDEENKAATVIVKDDSFSLAIGKKGVNVRLAVKLTEYDIDIRTETEAIEDELEYQTFEELQAQEIEIRNKKVMELAAQKAASIYANEILPGLPEGYVAPQARTYEDETNELDEALEETADKEETSITVTPAVNDEISATVTEETPVQEVTPTPVVEEKVDEPVVEVVKTEVKTTTSLEELEKNLANEANKSKKSEGKKFNRKKNKDEEEVDDSKNATDTSSGTRMSIYTEEELREMEEEEANAVEDEYDDDDIDYDEYDEYYDDDNK